MFNIFSKYLFAVTLPNCFFVCLLLCVSNEYLLGCFILLFNNKNDGWMNLTRQQAHVGNWMKYAEIQHSETYELVD